MPISLKDEHLFNEAKAKIFRVGQEGISKDDLARLHDLADDIIAGRLDVITIVLAPGTDFSQDLSERIIEQLKVVFDPRCTDSSWKDEGIPGNYEGLHVDGQWGLDRQYLSFVDIRVHVNSGNHPPANCPEGMTQRDFDPYFVFGRVEHLEVWPQNLVQSYETLRPSIAVNLTNPAWNVFRAHGRLDNRASNVPVTHSVIPRVLAEAVLDPEATFTPLGSDDCQSVRSGELTHRITPFKKNPFEDLSGVTYGVARSFDLVNFPVGPTRSVGRGLVA